MCSIFHSNRKHVREEINLIFYNIYKKQINNYFLEKISVIKIIQRFFYCPFWIKIFNCWRAFNSAHFPFTQLLIWTVYYDSICSASVGFLLFAFAGYGGHSYFVIPKSNNKNKINMNIFENSKLHGTMLRFNTWTHNDGNFSKVIEFHEKIFHRNRETFKVW